MFSLTKSINSTTTSKNRFLHTRVSQIFWSSLNQCTASCITSRSCHYALQWSFFKNSTSKFWNFAREVVAQNYSFVQYDWKLSCTKINEMYNIWKIITINKHAFNALHDKILIRNISMDNLNKIIFLHLNINLIQNKFGQLAEKLIYQ